MATLDGMPPLVDAPPTTAAGMFAAQASGAGSPGPGSTPWPTVNNLLPSGVSSTYAPSARSAPPYVPPAGWPSTSPPPLAQSQSRSHRSHRSRSHRHHHRHTGDSPSQSQPQQTPYPHSYPGSPQAYPYPGSPPAQAWPEAAWPAAAASSSPWPDPNPFAQLPPAAASPFPPQSPYPYPFPSSYPAYADGGTYEPRTSESAFESAMHLFPPEGPPPAAPPPPPLTTSYSYSTSSSGGFEGGGGVPNELETRRAYDRPGSWRPDFRMPRTGIESLLPIVKRTNSAKLNIDLSPYELTPKLRFSLLRDPPIQYDLRDHLARIQFRDLRRPVTGYDLASFVTEPPIPHLRILHRRLPWYVDVAASNQVGTTLQDLFDTLHAFLHTPIYRSDLYNSAVDDEQRAKVIRAYRERCQGDATEAAVGVKRVDFLMRDCIFLGLAKGRDGTWDMRTRKA